MYDAIVVGAGPAGSSAALQMAKKGARVLLLERGEYPGSKNMFGGMLPRSLAAEELIPGFHDEAPWERHVVKRMLTILSETTSTSLLFESENFDHPPYNGFTLFRPLFDKWLAKKAQAAGATLMTGCLARELLREKGTFTGVRTGNGDLHAPVTILSDGVLSLLAKRAGLIKPPRPSDMAVGVKALFHLGEKEINERFGLARTQGMTREFLGCTEGIRGGGFIYTQLETLSVGLVFHLDSLKEKGIAPYDLFDRFVSRKEVRPLLKNGKLLEYSAHVLPEGGYGAIPKLSHDGLLVTGDAASLCYTNGLNQEGMNLAITSGVLAADAVCKGDLPLYEKSVRESFIARDMKTFARTSDLMHNDRLFSTYPDLIGTILGEVYKSDGVPRKKMGRLAYDALREALPVKQIISDLIQGGRSL